MTMPPESEVEATRRRRWRRYIVGYAMAPKKVNSVFRDPLIYLAAKQGIDLVPIDLDKPLLEQGPFDCVLHKQYGQQWRNQLHQFSAKYSDSIIIDQLDDIEKLHNRITMLQVVHQLSLSQSSSSSFGVPKQIFIQDQEQVPDHHQLEEYSLKFPLIAKPLLANGTLESHQMFLVFNEDGLTDLKPPFVLQEFVNHGGVVFKVYVAGDHVRCVKRRSLPDISDHNKINLAAENLLPFSQISDITPSSSSSSTTDQVDDSSVVDKQVIEEAEMPPSNFVTQMAQALRRGLNLNLFNFDMLRDSDHDNHYLVIDINYFPGYAKMPSYEPMLIDFFLDIFQQKNQTTTHSHSTDGDQQLEEEEEED